MKCLKCSGECWDNTKENIKRLSEGKKQRPQFACKDKECGWLQWPEKDQVFKGTTMPKTPINPVPRNLPHEVEPREVGIYMCHAQKVAIESMKLRWGVEGIAESTFQVEFDKFTQHCYDEIIKKVSGK